MKLRDQFPDSAMGMPLAELLQLTPTAHLQALMQPLSKYYETRLPLWRLMREFSVEVDPSEGEQQVECSFSEHGSNDLHKSARYYTHDRNTGEASERVYCHKCNLMKTAFWYVLKQCRDHQNMQLKDVLRHLESHYGIPFPRDLLLDFDPDLYFSMGEGDAHTRAVTHFSAARALRRLRENRDAFITGLKDLLIRGV